MAKKTGKYILSKALKDYGAKYIFGYTGGAIMPVYDEIANFKEIKCIKTRHEQGAAFAAQGYARATGDLGFVFTTSGPGATNTVTAVADAMMDSVPIMCITGQVPTSVVGTDAFQESDMVGIMNPITKHAVMVKETDEMAEEFYQLTEIALQGRPGPVHLDLPKDVQLNKSDNINYKTEEKDYYPHDKPKDDVYEEAVKIINNAERPVVFCGHGVILSGAEKEFQSFVEKGNLPFACTMQGISALPADHKLSLGMMGMHGTVAANRAILNADVIVSVGMRFSDRVTGKLSEYAKDAVVIHVEIDPAELNKNVKADFPINNDAKDALKEMLKLVKGKERKSWVKKIEENKKGWNEYIQPRIKKGVGSNGKLLMSTILDKLSEITEGEDNIVADVGIHEMMCARYYNYQRTNSFFASGGAGTMGFSLPTALGVKLARPDERVWAVMGDGGFQMNIQELGTILEYDLDIEIIILNNNVLGMVRQWQDLFFDKRFVETDMKNPDFMKIADAYDIPSKRVTEVTAIEDTLEWSIEQTGPTVIEFVTDEDEKILPMIPSGVTFDKMIETL